VKKLKLDGLLNYLYTPPDHQIPLNQRKIYDLRKYKPTNTIHRHTIEGRYKPDPQLLLEIIDGIGAEPEKTIYIGDSLMKDIQMAQQAKVCDVFAKYGISQKDDRYELLRRVSHWPENNVNKEKKDFCDFDKINVSYILKENFSEILNLFEFIPHKVGAGK
jgi:phosphoglycolate phosphatase